MFNGFHSSPLSHEVRHWGMWCHLAGLLFVLIPVFGGLIGAGIMWQLKKRTASFVADQGREALNFHLVIAFVQLVNLALARIYIGWLLYGLVWLFTLAVVLFAASQAKKGILYRYPLVPRLLL